MKYLAAVLTLAVALCGCKKPKNTSDPSLAQAPAPEGFVSTARGTVITEHETKVLDGANHHAFVDSLAYPDPKLTPGAVLAGIQKEDVCRPGYAKSVRNVPEYVKKHVYETYNITPEPGGYEVDHLVSLELGGSNDEHNLWPQPYHGALNAHMKDALENKLHSLVCTGQLTLDEAQKEISTDWVEAYKKYVSVE